MKSIGALVRRYKVQLARLDKKFYFWMIKIIFFFSYVICIVTFKLRWKKLCHHRAYYDYFLKYFQRYIFILSYNFDLDLWVIDRIVYYHHT